MAMATHRQAIGHETGPLAVGKASDASAYPGDPLADITAVERTDCVVSAGKLITSPSEVTVPDVVAA